MPSFQQLFVADPAGAAGIDLDRKLFVARKRIEHELPAEQRTFFPSLSSRTLIYKGMFTTPQLAEFFPDLADERIESALALVHSRFSTNTFPSAGRWPTRTATSPTTARSTPCRATATGCAPARACCASDLLPGLERAFPICTPGGSDSATLRRGARTAAPRRSQPAARDADDDPRGVGEPRHDGRREARVLPLPLVADGAVGRPGQRGVHRRHRHRRRARPQRPAPEPLLGHRRRPRGAWPARSASSTSTRPRSCARAACSRAACS